MNSKERVRTALNHQDTDRVPIQIYTTPEIMKALTTHFRTREILPILGIDFRTVAATRVRPGPAVPEGCDFADEWGIGYAMVAFGSGTYPESAYLPFTNMKRLDEVHAYPWPSLDDFDFSTIEAQCDANAEFAVCYGNAGIPDIVNGVGRGRGMDQVLIDIMTNDEVGVALIDKRCDVLYARCRRALEAGNGKIDILCLGEDCGNQAGPMFSPAVFDAFFRPRLKRFYDLAHEFGAKAMMHSCGNTRRIMPTFIDMGLDVLDAMQPEPDGMDPEAIKREFGDRLTFCGLISTQKTLPFGTQEECRAEARHRLRTMTENGGYIFAPAHCIQPDTPLENVLAIYEEALQLEPGALMRR